MALLLDPTPDPINRERSDLAAGVAREGAKRRCTVLCGQGVAGVQRLEGAGFRIAMLLQAPSAGTPRALGAKAGEPSLLWSGPCRRHEVARHLSEG